MPDDDRLGIVGVCTRPGCLNISWAGCICYACSQKPRLVVGGPQVDPLPKEEYRKDAGHKKLRGGTGK